MRRPPASSKARRNVLRGMAAGLAGAAFPHWSHQALAADGIEVTGVADGLTMLTGTGTNLLVLRTNEGKVLVDSGAFSTRDAILGTLDELSPEPVVAVFNTHWHPDQVGSNEPLGAAGATIFAHEKTRQRLTAGYYRPADDQYVAALPGVALPTETTYDQEQIEIGGQAIDYGYLIEAHTDGDIYVSFPDLNVIAVGDVLSPAGDPVFDWFGGGWLGGRLDSLDRLLEISNGETRFVPSHGPVVGRTELQVEHELLAVLFERIVEHIRLGETAKDMLDAGVLDGLGRSFDDPYTLLYDLHKGFWAHHNKLMHDIV